MSLRSYIHVARRLVQNGATISRPLRSISAVAQEPLISDLSASYIELEEKYGAHNYHPLPVVLSRGKGEYPPTLYVGDSFFRSLSSHNETPEFIARRNTCVGRRWQQIL